MNPIGQFFVVGSPGYKEAYEQKTGKPSKTDYTLVG